jgi:hypothetical protein
VSRIEPIGPGTPRPEPVQRPTPGERARRRTERDPQRDGKRRDERRKDEPGKGGRIDVRA